MLANITLKFSEGDVSVTLPAEGITIFVGPNNSGKSLVLREIEAAITSGAIQNLKLLQNFDIVWPTEAEINAEISALQKNRPIGLADDHLYFGRFQPGGGLDATPVHKESLFNIARERQNKSWFAQHYLRFRLIRLDGRTRFTLTDNRPTGDLIGPPQNALAHLFSDDERRLKIRELIYDAFNRYFVIDPLEGGSLRIRLSDMRPGSDEQSLGREARAFHSAATYIKDGSDGVQAYVGIVTAVLSGEFKTILLDEPEAFLHPPLARKLGKQLAAIAVERKGTLFAATHSADFLIGCIQSSTAVRVVRLEYLSGKSKGKVVDANLLDQIFKNPLLRSANVISALFHDGVVVTESDNDRAFYAEIYYRLAEENPNYPSLLFVNAQNKQTAKNIVDPLRKFGIPAAAIVDIDVIKDGGSVWTDWQQSIQIPNALHSGFSAQRDAIKKCFDSIDKDMKRDGGVECLSGSDRPAADQLFDVVQQYGLFVVRKGELESWLPNLEAVGKKTDWTISVLEKLGSDPKFPSYVKPSTGDVWDFMRGIVAWVQNPTRHGTS